MGGSVVPSSDVYVAMEDPICGAGAGAGTVRTGSGIGSDLNEGITAGCGCVTGLLEVGSAVLEDRVGSAVVVLVFSASVEVSPKISFSTASKSSLPYKSNTGRNCRVSHRTLGFEVECYSPAYRSSSPCTDCQNITHLTCNNHKRVGVLTMFTKVDYNKSC